jgi:hypothetical protein
MDELRRSIENTLGSTGPIPRQLVRGWIQQASDVEVDALLYRLTSEAWSRIEPRVESAEVCALIQRYLLRCIQENPNSDVALSRYEAAGDLEAWVDHLAGIEDTREVLQGVVSAVTALFLAGDDQVRRAIGTGFLEHVLEQVTMRPLFAHWAHDDRLREAWQHALAWGEAHPNFVKGLRAGLRAAAPDNE